jgi:probable HAF family extracellular repeat protein
MVLAAALWITFSCPTAWSASPSFQGLGHLPGYDISVAYNVSSDGSVVVGESFHSAGSEAFRWTRAEGMQGLGHLAGGGSHSEALAVSGDGSIIVGESEFTPGAFRAFRWTAAEGMQNLGFLPGVGDSSISRANGISSDGSTIVGQSGLQAFRWTSADGMQRLRGLPVNSSGVGLSSANGLSADGSVVVGSHNNGAFRWTSDGGLENLGSLPGREEEYLTHAAAVSADGSVVVGSSSTVFSSMPLAEAFRRTSGSGMQGLGQLPGLPAGLIADSGASAISGDGSIVVGISSSSSALGHESFIWDAAHGMRSLQQVLVHDFGLDLTSWTLSVPRGISADGRTIVGDGINPLGQGEAWIATIPEPSSLVLVGLGCAFLFLLRRRQPSRGRPSEHL